jgi:hypothetical protein
MKLSTEDAKRLLPLGEVWRRLGIPGDPPVRDGKNVRCPWPVAHQHEDAKASFGTHAGGTRYKCFGCGAQGDAIDLIAQWQGLPRNDAWRTFMEWAGGENQRAIFRPAASSSSSRPETPALESLALRRLTNEEIEQLAATRSIRPEALSLAQALRTLRYATVCGFPSWVLIDDARKIAEARRLDGQPYPAYGSLGQRKAHTLRGSRKNWPVGLSILERCPRARRHILLVEGGPDYLAALHFIITQDQWHAVPIALLGRQTGRTSLDPHALELLRGRRVRIYPHQDADGGGVESARDWGRQLQGVGCTVDGFTFAGLTDRLGAPLKDLNELVFLEPQLIHRITHLIP